MSLPSAVLSRTMSRLVLEGDFTDSDGELLARCPGVISLENPIGILAAEPWTDSMQCDITELNLMRRCWIFCGRPLQGPATLVWSMQSWVDLESIGRNRPSASFH